MKFLMKCILRSIFCFQIFKFPMLTHVCGVARGPLPHAIAAHMRQHEKIEKLEAWNRDLPAFWRDFHEIRDTHKNCILFDFDRFQHA